MRDYSNNHIEVEQDLLIPIFNGSKRATTRIGIRNYTLGKGLIYTENDQPDAFPINIIAITYKKFKNLTDREAQLEGYGNVAELKDKLMLIYPDVKDNTDITLIEFEVLMEEVR